MRLELIDVQNLYHCIVFEGLQLLFIKLQIEKNESRFNDAHLHSRWYQEAPSKGANKRWESPVGA